MKIASGIDETQFYENGEFTENSKVLFMQYADGYFSAMDEIRPGIRAGVCGLKGRINERLQEHSAKAYESINNILLSEEYKEVSAYDYELKCFQTSAHIYQLEKTHDSCIYDNFEYTEHFLEIYQQMVLYFRRIQLGLAKDLQMECMVYIREKKMSVYAVAQILLDSGIGGREKVAMKLAEYYAEQDMVAEAVFLLTFIGENSRPEWLEAISLKKMEIMDGK